MRAGGEKQRSAIKVGLSRYGAEWAFGGSSERRTGLWTGGWSWEVLEWLLSPSGMLVASVRVASSFVTNPRRVYLIQSARSSAFKP